MFLCSNLFFRARRFNWQKMSPDQKSKLQGFTLVNSRPPSSLMPPIRLVLFTCPLSSLSSLYMTPPLFPFLSVHAPPLLHLISFLFMCPPSFFLKRSFLPYNFFQGNTNTFACFKRKLLQNKVLKYWNLSHCYFVQLLVCDLKVTRILLPPPPFWGYPSKYNMVTSVI